MNKIIIEKYARCQSNNNNEIAHNIIMCDVGENVIEQNSIFVYKLKWEKEGKTEINQCARSKQYRWSCFLNERRNVNGAHGRAHGNNLIFKFHANCPSRMDRTSKRGGLVGSVENRTWRVNWNGRKLKSAGQSFTIEATSDCIAVRVCVCIAPFIAACKWQIQLNRSFSIQ